LQDSYLFSHTCCIVLYKMAQAQSSELELDTQLHAAIQEAFEEVYNGGKKSPIDKIKLADLGTTVYLKREDLNEAHCYKWRGAYNRIRVLSEKERMKGVVAASAGNHAQGVALAAKRFGIHATVFMPKFSPYLKQHDAKVIGGENVEIIMVGETFQEAMQEALKAAKKDGKTLIHAYDDLQVMAGQGTIGEEINEYPEGPFDAIFIQIGGGGIASGIACAVKHKYPDTKIIGVECAGQLCMKAALQEHKPVLLDSVDSFCDGTAMSRAGELTWQICSKYLDEHVTVTNEDVCLAIKTLWENHRCILEPSGALGFAGYLDQLDHWKNKKVLCIATGSNVDFDKLAWIARHASVSNHRLHGVRIELKEEPRSLLHLLSTGLDHFDIRNIQYGKSHSEQATVIIGFEAKGLEFDSLMSNWDEHQLNWEELVADEIDEYHKIALDNELLSNPVFVTVKLKGIKESFSKLLEKIPEDCNICYLNYSYDGHGDAHATLGIEFSDTKQRSEFTKQKFPKDKYCLASKLVSIDSLNI